MQGMAMYHLSYIITLPLAYLITDLTLATNLISMYYSNSIVLSIYTDPEGKYKALEKYKNDSTELAWQT